MSVQQLSVFVENAPGRLKAIAQVLAQASINMQAISLADTYDFGVVRLIVDDNEKALQVMDEHHFVAKLSDILAVEVTDEPGQLLELLGQFEAAGLNIEYMYAFKIGKENRALMLFKLDDQAKAAQIMRQSGHRVLESQQEVMNAI